eukprot:359346-Chlamydomonas_euryale.AAC.2
MAEKCHQQCSAYASLAIRNVCAIRAACGAASRPLRAPAAEPDRGRPKPGSASGPKILRCSAMKCQHIAAK